MSECGREMLCDWLCSSGDPQVTYIVKVNLEARIKDGQHALSLLQVTYLPVRPCTVSHAYVAHYSNLYLTEILCMRGNDVIRQLPKEVHTSFVL